MMDACKKVTVINGTSKGRLLAWDELVTYRDLFRYLVWRQVKVRYAQSAIGIGWAIIQPLFSMVLFTVVFGLLAKLPTDGAPYALFSLAAVLPWTYFSNAVTDGVASLVGEVNMLRKIYFPRIMLPMSAVVAKLVDFGIAAVMMIMLMAIYRQPLTLNILWMPLLLVYMVLAASGICIWLAALSVQYRDVKHALPFLVQFGMYASPVIYSTNLIPTEYRWIFALNPVVGIVEGFRSSLVGNQAFPIDLVLIGLASTLFLLTSGLWFFNKRERAFADFA
jgi:lipopolysaccharide transport system permease protein